MFGGAATIPPRAAGIAWRALSGSAARQPRAQIVDPAFVNAHHCVVQARSHRETLQVLRLIRRGLRLLNKGTHAGATRLFAKGVTVSNTHTHGSADPAAWVACNAMGLSLFLRGEHDEAEAILGQAQRHCEHLSEQGLINDAFSDMCGVLNDRAANLICARNALRTQDAVGMLKRAKFMAERAYRPNHLLIDSLHGNLAVALMQVNELDQAFDLAKRAVRTGDAMEAVMTGVQDKSSRGTRRALEHVGHSKSLAVLALIAVKTGQMQEALATARRAHEALESLPAPPPPLEAARLYMCLASVHWLLANQSAVRRTAQQQMGVAACRLEKALALVEVPGVRSTHADRVVCRINATAARRCLAFLAGPAARTDTDCVNQETRGRGEKDEWKRDFAGTELAALRRLRKRLGPDHSLVVHLKDLVASVSKLSVPAPGGVRPGHLSLLPPPVELPVLRCGLGLHDVMQSLETHGKQAAPQARRQ